MSLIKIHSNIRDYGVHFESASVFLPEILKERQPCFFVVDSSVWKLYRSTLLKDLPPKDVLVLPISEEKKRLDSVYLIYDTLTQRSAKRNMTLVTIGGGIAQDISGFAASTLYRGLKWVFVPTTLLAQCDSCIGSKTSLNYKDYKNIIGTFYPPVDVYIDTAFLDTQKKIDYFSGLGEVVKLNILGGATTVKRAIAGLEPIMRREPKTMRKVIYLALNIKKNYIEGDEFDSGRRNLLNYGHCFGHAIESVSKFAVPHGQAVVAGMILANLVSFLRGELSLRLHELLMTKLLIPSLVVKLKKDYLEPEAIIAAMKNDKKRVSDNLSIVMLQDGHRLVRANDVAFEEVRKALLAFGC